VLVWAVADPLELLSLTSKSECAATTCFLHGRSFLRRLGLRTHNGRSVLCPPVTLKFGEIQKSRATFLPTALALPPTVVLSLSSPTPNETRRAQKAPRVRNLCFLCLRRSFGSLPVIEPEQARLLYLAIVRENPEITNDFHASVSRSFTTTGPKYGFPEVHLFVLTVTAASSSNLMYEHQERRASLRANDDADDLTFLTLPPGIRILRATNDVNPQTRIATPSHPTRGCQNLLLRCCQPPSLDSCLNPC